MEHEITVVIADDHPIFRKGLKQTLDEVSGVRVVGEAADGDAALQCVLETRATLALLDVDMPKKDGLQVAQALREQNTDALIVFMTMYKEEGILTRAIDLGVRGYLLKDNACDDVRQCIEVVTSGELYVSARVTDLLVSRNHRVRSLERNHPALATLTPSERRILSLVGEHKSSRQIADELCISEATVDKHRSNISRKLDLRGSHSLLKFALDNKAAL